MNSSKLILTIVLALLSLHSVKAQTKAKSTTTKSTTKAGAKGNVKTINVYVCTSTKDKFFHKYSSCKNLNNCGGEIKNIKSATELKKYKRKSCLHCFNL